MKGVNKCFTYAGHVNLGFLGLMRILRFADMVIVCGWYFCDRYGHGWYCLVYPLLYLILNICCTLLLCLYLAYFKCLCQS